MSRTWNAALMFGLVALAAIAVGQHGSERASAADCVWQKHSKRVVKHVKRHGKQHKVIRHKHWWSCDPAGAAADGGAGEAGTVGAAGSGSPPSTSTLGVKAEDAPDFRFILSKQTVPYGKVTVYFNNQGQDQHDFNIAPAGDPLVGSIGLTDPSTQKNASFNLGPGTYKLWCDLEGHDALGMNATLNVSP